LLFFVLTVSCNHERSKSGEEAMELIDIQKTVERLQSHIQHLTVTVGERSVRLPENLENTAAYIETFYRDLEIPVQRELYNYHDFTVANIVAKLALSSNPTRTYLVGAHYDSVWGTVGADDNASAVAVQLETARALSSLAAGRNHEVEVVFVSFPLEEPPVYGTRYMGSKVCAKQAKKENQRLDGMLCLEMVGYTCHQKGCQSYPFPLMFMGYPEKGDFIGIVGNFKSKGLTRSLYRAFQKNVHLPVVKLTVPFAGWIMPSVRLSDHASFWDQGYKAVMITDSAFYRNPHYHQPSDTMDRLDFQFMAELVESLVIFFRSVGSKQ
jgi:Zn-dependent M28 family amino/carboxypeptidase